MKKSLREEITEFAINNKDMFSWKEIAEKFNLEPTSKTLKQLSDWYRYYVRTGKLLPETDEVQEVEVNKANDFIAVPEGFKVKSMWQNASGKMLYSFTSAEEKEDILLKAIESFKPSTTDYIKESPVSVEKRPCGLFINQTDFHINKLTLDGSTPKDKCEKYYSCLVKTVETAKRYHNVDTIIYVVGSDFFNTDTYFNTTTNGTPQDNSLHFDKAFELGLQLSISSIDYLLNNCNTLQVIQLSGNHDLTTSYYLGKTLEAYYRNVNKITFDSVFSVRKCVTMGNTSICLHHGNMDLKYAKDIFANFFPKEYTNKFIEFSVGDKHFSRSFNDGRLTIRQYPCLSTSDKWTDSKNYYNVPSVLAQVYDYEDGRILEIDIKI